MGMTYVQKLKHMVGDKIRARARGKMQPQVKQPAEGRTNNGGLRFGEMERDCLLAYGAASNIRDRLSLSSDVCAVHICSVCNSTMLSHETSDIVYCKRCNRSDTGLRVSMPYGFKLFTDELKAISLNVQLHVVPEDASVQKQQQYQQQQKRRFEQHPGVGYKKAKMLA